MDAGTLVARAAARIAAEMGWPSEPALRKLPEVAAILTAPDDVRRECVLILAAHVFDEDDPALALCGRRVLPHAARKRLPLSAGDIAALLSLVRRRGSKAALLVKSLRGQIEAAAPGWSAGEREQLGPLIENAAIAADHHVTATALRRLAAPPGSDLRLGLIAPGDNFSAPAASKAEAAARAARLRSPVARIASLLDALLEAGDVEGVVRSPYGDYGNPRSRRLANACVHAIATIGPPSAIGEHTTLDRTIRHGSLRREIGSGNVPMEPGSTFLPIGARRANGLFLPFDDDPTLNLTLGKAFLLADDERIEDEAIAGPIRGG